MAKTFAAPRCKRQSVNPPVLQPKSAQIFAPTSTAKAARACSSFNPARETNSATRGIVIPRAAFVIPVYFLKSSIPPAQKCLLRLAHQPLRQSCQHCLNFLPRGKPPKIEQTMKPKRRRPVLAAPFHRKFPGRFLIRKSQPPLLQRRSKFARNDLVLGMHALGIDLGDVLQQTAAAEGKAAVADFSVRVPWPGCADVIELEKFL